MKINQDYVYVTDQPVGPFPNLLVVADGMGGHKAGDFASKVYGEDTVLEELKETPLDKPEEILRNIVSIANHKLIERGSDGCEAGRNGNHAGGRHDRWQYACILRMWETAGSI